MEDLHLELAALGYHDDVWEQQALSFVCSRYAQKIQWKKDKLALDPAWARYARARTARYMRNKRASDPAYREREREYARAAYAKMGDDEKKALAERNRKRWAERMKDPEYRERNRQRTREYERRKRAEAKAKGETR